MDSWYHRGIKNYIDEVTEDREVMSLFKRGYVQKLINYKKIPEYKYLLRHKTSTSLYYSRKLWNLIAFGEVRERA